MPTPLASIGQISIRVHDIERAAAFYRDALGLEFLFEAASTTSTRHGPSSSRAGCHSTTSRT